MAEGSSSLARIMTGLRNWVAATAGDIAVTQADVATADADARRRIAEIRATGGHDQDAAVAEILGETRAANGARIAGLPTTGVRSPTTASRCRRKWELRPATSSGAAAPTA
ncbi:MAG: hypothetical protein QOF25_177 [Mycobacterium sp.]|jgi:hypothetical protein|nr:hypothetical protein [Mycobacterium sp.]